ncbi:MAG: hypothetical protein IID15_04060, partial [Candidatus Marinimicrobia bacterium]|nr:hypothetical protein [Candidatus Neomarinimicrobiota bacterium]
MSTGEAPMGSCTTSPFGVKRNILERQSVQIGNSSIFVTGGIVVGLEREVAARQRSVDIFKQQFDAAEASGASAERLVRINNRLSFANTRLSEAQLVLTEHTGSYDD